MIFINISIETIYEHKSFDLMNKIIEILKFLNESFQKGPQGLTNYDEDLINPHLNQINQSMDKKTSQIFKKDIEKIDSLKELSIEELSKKN